MSEYPVKVYSTEGYLVGARSSNRQMRGGSGGMHPERRVTLESVRFDKIEPHPLSRKIYGKPEPTLELLRSIEQLGLLQPLIINEIECEEVSPWHTGYDFQILAGHTRAEAWRILVERGKIKKEWVSCKIVRLSKLEAERFVIESNFQRIKTPEQLAREFKELQRIEAALAKERQQAGVPSKLTEGKGESADRAAKKLGMSKNTAKKLVSVVDAADTGDLQAKVVVAQLNEGTISISRAHETIRQGPTDPQVIDAGKKIAQELSQLFANAEVVRSKKDGLFHMTIQDLTPEQIKQYALIGLA